jgi:histidine ammonia-lyase
VTSGRRRATAATSTGRDLTLAEVVAVARPREVVDLAGTAVAAMTKARALADQVREPDLPTYGHTIGLGARKSASLRCDDEPIDWRQIAESRAGQNPSAAADVVRAAMLVPANQMAGASTSARPAVAEPCRRPEHGSPAGRALARLVDSCLQYETPGDSY